MLRRKKLLTKAHAEFIETRLGTNFHPAFGSREIQFNPDTNRFEGEPPQQASQPRPGPSPLQTSSPRGQEYAGAANSQRVFRLALEDYNRGRGDARAYEEQSWDGIFEIMEDALAKYENVGKSRKAMRKMGEYAPMIQGWLRLFPDSTFSSTLKGAFGMVLEAAERLDAVRVKALKKLAEIPDRIARAELYIEIHGGEGSERLHAKSSELYVTILTSVELILAWMEENPTKKYMRSLVLGSHNYAKEIDLKLDDISDLAAQVKEEADICSMRKINEIKDSLGDTNDDVKRLLQQSQEMGITTERGLSSSLLKLESISEQLESLPVELYNRFSSFFSAFPENPHGHYPGANISPVARRKTFATEILRFLDYSPVHVAEDLRTVLAHGHSSSHADHDRLNWVLQSHSIRSWISSKTSGLLLINGRSEHLALSPMSFYCALLIESLKQTRIAQLYHFCGLRTNSDDPMAGPVGMIKSLIAQLLARYDFDLLFLKGQKTKKLSKPKRLCWIFAKLLAQLGEDALVFCIIDGVTWYETKRRAKELCEIVKILAEIAQGEGAATATIKVLVTAPNTSLDVGRDLNGGQILDVPEFVDGSKQGFNPGDMQRTRAAIETAGRADGKGD